MIGRGGNTLVALAALTSLAWAGTSLGATLFADDFNDNQDGTDPAGWIYNQPGADPTQPANRTSVQGGVVEVLGQSSGTFAQLTPGSGTAFNSYETGTNNKVILSADIAGSASSTPHISQNTGMYLYAAATAADANSDYYNFQFHSNGTIALRERTSGTAAGLATTTADALVEAELFESIDLAAMNAWRLEVTHNGTSADLELFLNGVSILTHTDESPRNIARVTPAVYGANGKDYRFDNVQLDAVPEPAALGLLGMAGLLLGRRRSH